MSPVWFKAKRYGYGWYPSSWQGWTILAAYLLGIVGIVINQDLDSHSVSDTLIASVLPTLVLTGFLILICVLTGEKARWRWGGK